MPSLGHNMEKRLRLENFIDGEFVPYSGDHLDSFDPSRDEVWAEVPDSGPEEVELAVKAALKAFPSWSGQSPAARARVLSRVADLLEKRLEEFAVAESRDQGKPFSLARDLEIPRAVHNFRFFATAAQHHIDTSNYMTDRDAINYTTRSPVGVAGLISPWNLPMYLLTFKVAPALAAGNTVVAKPSEMTSVTAWMLCDLFKQAGVPAGVVNFVFGTGPRAGEAIVQHPLVPIISFTGSTATAERIRKSCAAFCKKLSLELGGKNPAVVFSDVDLETCIPNLVRASFANQGEICLCASRIFIQEDIYDMFLAKFVEQARAIKVGDPGAADTRMGALVSREHLAKVRSFVQLANTEGATVQCGEGVDSLDLPPQHAKGYFMRPTVISGMSDSSALMQQEIFGPVTCLTPFSTEDEVIERSNNCMYGLSASVWTKDISVAHRVSRKIQCGTVWVNCWLVRDLNMPFGGIKASGVGREGAKESLEFYTEVKTICVKL